MPNPLSLANRVALITGGASGIGRETALAFARQGASLALLDRDEKSLARVAEQVASLDAPVETFLADVSKEDDVRLACDGAFEAFGRLDIVFANAGINGVWAPLDDITIEEFDQTIAVNLRGTFLTVKLALPYLKVQGGSVLVTSSVNGTRTFSNTGATAYSASKAGQVALVKMLAVELGHYGIRVNAICPGAISTNIGESTDSRDVKRVKVPVQYPEGTSSLVGSRPGRPDQVADLALFLASDMAAHITGEVVYIDAGSSLVVG